jgi:hypothetical protein
MDRNLLSVSDPFHIQQESRNTMRRSILISAVFAIASTFAYSIWSAASDEPTTQSVSNQQSEEESIDVRLARAHLKLAKLDVERAMEANRKTPKLYSDEFIELLKLHVEIDEAELEQSLKNEDADAREVVLRNAESSLKIAQMNLKATRAVFENLPSIDSKYDLETAKVNLEIAEFELEQAKQLGSSDPKAAVRHLQRQINQLRHQILQLRMKH